MGNEICGNRGGAVIYGGLLGLGDTEVSEAADKVPRGRVLGREGGRLPIVRE